MRIRPTVRCGGPASTIALTTMPSWPGSWNGRAKRWRRPEMGFLFASKLDAARAHTRRNQAAAADPAASAWVSANAGTGKTHVLTMRVLRLLLGGTPPERILALTYTKAAAAEMSKRVFARLAEWVMSDEPSLTRTLAQLLDRAPTPADMQRARQLFAVAIETPGGLKVQTIHAFCERLLQRFPIEAGVPPGFAILDEQERSALLNRATDEMLAAAAVQKSGPLWRALQTAIAYAVNGGFDNVLQQALGELGAAPRPAGEPALAAAQQRLRATFGVRPDIAADEIIAHLSETFADDLLAHLVSALRAGNKSDARGAQCLNAALVASSGGRWSWRRPWRCCASARTSWSVTAPKRRAALRSTLRIWSARRQPCSPPPRRWSGCSISSTAASITSWSMRRRTRAPSSGT